jgi:hypothetical protein
MAATAGAGRVTEMIALPPAVVPSSTPVRVSMPTSALLLLQVRWGTFDPVARTKVRSAAAGGSNGDQLVMSPMTPSVNRASTDSRTSRAPCLIVSGSGVSHIRSMASWT